MEPEDRGGDGATAVPIDRLESSGLVSSPAKISSGGEAAATVDGGACSDGACEVGSAPAMMCGGGEADDDVDGGGGNGPAVAETDCVDGCGQLAAPAVFSDGRAAVDDADDSGGGGSGSSENCDDGVMEASVVRVVAAIAAPKVISSSGDAAASADGGISENWGRDGAAAMPTDREESCGLVAAQPMISGGGSCENRCSNGDMVVSVDRVEGCELVAAAEMISGGREVASIVDDGGGSGRNGAIAALVAAPALVSGSLEAAAAVDGGGSGGKKKRGRPQRGQVRPLAAKKVKVKVKVEEEGEDVCFICFDGGSLVLCDRRGCPKAYHPACVKRDEAFFQSKAKWNCGWHICSICQKAAHHMCYTCTYSLCKACTKDADYLSVRENKGLCATCMRTVMMIERVIPGNKDTVQVDFDDKSSWEYLFKVYWVYLKEKLTLSLDELIQAKSPYKAAEPILPKVQPLDAICGSADCKSSISNVPSRHLKVTDPKKRRIKEQRNLPNIKDCQSRGKSSSVKSTNLSGSPEWATKELLEFVVHMKNGDLSMLSQFDIQGLLLEYIKINNLRDPRRKSQIICDSRLMNLFFKPRVGHFEMLKLLEYHFLIKEDNQKENTLGNIVRTVPDQVEGGGNNEILSMIDKDKKRKARRKGEERGPQTNVDEFAAIDVHNINLIYLRRELMENLVTANGKFYDKIVGSIVRIRISGGDPKQDIYRLVQVIGTFKAAVPYKVCGKTLDIMLVILNLHKKETVAIDSISNQDFSEDECRRLRQSIRFGLVKRMTVGQIQEKARALQEVRLNDWLETEMLRLNHLRDRASEKGRKKELRECIEKIELLKTPEERHRRLNENLQVHADPRMDPNCNSDDDVGEVSKQKQVDQVKPILSGSRKLGRDLIPMQSKNKQAKFNSDKGPSSKFKGKMSELPKRKETAVSETSTVPLLPKRGGTFVSETPTVPLSNGSKPSAYRSETEKLWQYRDPNGKIQGPFSLVQLRKWSTTGYFPPDMRVWDINTDEGESLLLTNVLNGILHKSLPARSNMSLPDRLCICEDRHSSSVNPMNDGKRSNGSWNRTSATSVHQKIHKDRRWLSDTTNGNLCSHGNTLYPYARHENQFDSQSFSGQSSVGSWNTLNIGSNNSVSNASVVSVSRSVDSSDQLKINGQNLSSSTLVPTHSRNLKLHISKDQKSSQSCAPVQDLVMEELPSPTPKPGDRDEKACLGIQNLPCPAPMAVDVDEKVESNLGNLPNSLPNARERDEKIQATESKPPDTKWTSASSTPTPNGVDEKADLFAQNLKNPSPKTVDGDELVNLQNPCPAPMAVDMDEKVDSRFGNLSNSLPNARDRDEKIQRNDNKAPGTIWTSCSGTPMLSCRNEEGVLPSLASNPINRDEEFWTHERKPCVTSLTFDIIRSKPSDIDEKAGIGVQNLRTPSPPKNSDGKVDSAVQNLPSALRDPGDGKANVQANESKPPGLNLTFVSSTEKPSDTDETAGTGIPYLSCSLPKTVDVDGKVDTTIQNFPSSPLDLRDGNEKVQANESKPPGTGLTCSSSPPKPSDIDGKAGMCARNLPCPSPKMVDEDAKVDSTAQNPMSWDNIVLADENKQPGASLTCSSSPPDSSDRDAKAGIGIHNLPSLSTKTVCGDGKVDLPSPSDGNEKVQANKSKPPDTSSTFGSSTSELNERDEEANGGVQNLPSPSQKIIDGDEIVGSAPNTRVKNEKVDANESKPPNDMWTSNSSLVEGDRSLVEKIADEWNGYSPSGTRPPEVACDQFVTSATKCDQFAPHSISDAPPSSFNWKSIDYKPIELTTLAEESVSDLLAEVDAMEAQGDVASPSSAMYSGDDFFEDSKGDYFASIHGMGHLFDFGKTDDVSSTGKSSSFPTISEPLYPTRYAIFDSTKRSNGDTSTSSGIGTRYNNTGINNHISFETRSMGSNWGNTNPGLGGLTLGMTYMGWGSNQGVAQVNMDMNRNTYFGFMGHERHGGDWGDDGSGS